MVKNLRVLLWLKSNDYPPVISVRISFANVMITPPARVIRAIYRQPLEQQVQWASEALIVFTNLGTVEHLHNHGKVLLFCGRFMIQIKHQGLQQCSFRLFPERIDVASRLWRCVADQVSHQFENILIITDVAKRVVTERLFHIDQVKHLDLVAPGFQKVACIAEQLAFRISNQERAIALHDIGLCIKSRLAGTGSTDDQDIEVAPVFSAVESHLEIFGQQEIVFFARIPITAAEFVNITSTC